MHGDPQIFTARQGRRNYEGGVIVWYIGNATYFKNATVRNTICAHKRQVVDTMGIHNPSKGSRFIMGNLTM